jgi:hypothetical protein
VLRPFCVFVFVVAACSLAAACASSTSAPRSKPGAPEPTVTRRGPHVASVVVHGGTQRERRLLRAIVSRTGADPLERVRIDSRRRRMAFVARRTDPRSSTRGKWLALVVARAFADAVASDGVPRIRAVTVVTRGIPAGEGRRLVIRLPVAQRVPAKRPAAARALVARPRLRSLVLRRVVAFRIQGHRADAAEVRGTLSDPSQYLRVLSTIAGATPAGRGAYYELDDVHGKALMRFGLVNGLAPRDRLVAWVRPSLLRRW